MCMFIEYLAYNNVCLEPVLVKLPVHKGILQNKAWEMWLP